MNEDESIKKEKVLIK